MRGDVITGKLNDIVSGVLFFAQLVIELSAVEDNLFEHACYPKRTTIT